MNQTTPTVRHLGPALSDLRNQLEVRLRRCARLVEKGVIITDAATTYIDEEAEVGKGTRIEPNTTILGPTKIAAGCVIGPNTVLRESVVGDGCRILASMVEDSELEAGVEIGPFSHLRPGSHIEAGAHIGNFAEIKNSRIGQNTKVGHFSYIGDARIGRDVNIGAGAITCNYDGEAKHETIIQDGAFIGSDTMLVAPVQVGAGARTGAGAVVTKDVPAGALVVGMPARRTPQAKSRRRLG